MKVCGPLPEVMVPFAERMFAWFPEVMVALGHPALQDQFALPPQTGAQMTLEETADHKLVQVKLRRHKKRVVVATEEDSPFSKSRANAHAQAVARLAAAARAAGADNKAESQVVQRPSHSNRSEPHTKPPASAQADGRSSSKDVAGARLRADVEAVPTQQRFQQDQEQQQRLQQDQEHQQRLQREQQRLQQEQQQLEQQQEQEKQQQLLLQQQLQRQQEQNNQKQRLQDQEQEQEQQRLPAQQGSEQHQQNMQEQMSEQQLERQRPRMGSSREALRKQQTPQQHQDQEEHHQPNQASQLEQRRQAQEQREQKDQRNVSDVAGDETEKPVDRRESCPDGAASVDRATQISAAAAPRIGKKRVMGRADADPGSPKLSSPGSHNPWGPSTAIPNEPLPAPAIQDEGQCSGLSTPTIPQKNFQARSPEQVFHCGDLPLVSETHMHSNGASAFGSLGNLSASSVSTLAPTPKGKTPLSLRRNMSLNNPWTRGKEGKKHCPNEAFPESSPPAVLQLATPKDMPVMPGAFSQCRTLFFFDWDDTLCPTTWIRDTLKSHLADSMEWSEMAVQDYEMDWRYQIPAWFGQPLPDIPDVRDKIVALQKAAINVINIAQSLGVVCIVTNAVDGWVEKTTKKWLPLLSQYIFGHGSRPPIQVLYGQVEYERPIPGSLAHNLPFINGLEFSELMLWKKTAMLNALHRINSLYRVDASTKRDLVNIVSVGDSEFEMQGGELAVLAYQESLALPSGSQRPQSAPATREAQGRPFFKAVKLQEGPSVDEIVAQLDMLTKSMTQIVATRSNIRVESEELQDGEWSAATCTTGEEQPEMRVQRLQRIQTV